MVLLCYTPGVDAPMWAVEDAELTTHQGEPWVRGRAYSVGIDGRLERQIRPLQWLWVTGLVLVPW